METSAVAARDAANIKAKSKTVAKENQESAPETKDVTEDQALFVTVSKEKTDKENPEQGQGPQKVETEEPKLGFEFELSTKRLTFQVDEKTDEVIVKIVDAKSGEEIRQIPPEELVDLAETLEEYKGRIVNSVL